MRQGRVEHVSSEDFRQDPAGSVVRRSRRVEAYILAWFAIEGLMFFEALDIDQWPAVIPRTLMIIRILDIFQTSVNMSVFDQLRTDERLVISSAVRTLTLSFLNYLELIVCFGILYMTLPGLLVGASTNLDALYFSVVTQLTIGYGDVHPIGWARVVAVAQGLVSVAFTILILGRIVSVLPKIGSVMDQPRHED